MNRQKLNLGLQNNKRLKPQIVREYIKEINIKNFDNNSERGLYKFRLYPENTLKNPDGFLQLVSHRIHHTKNEKPIWVLGHESYVDGSGSHYLENILLQLNHKFKQNKDYFTKMPKDLKAAVDDLYPWVQYLYPILLWGEVYIEPGSNSDYPTYRVKEVPQKLWKDFVPVGVILQVEASTVVKRLNDLSNRYPNIDHHRDGRCLTLRRSEKKYEIDALDPSEFPKSAEALIEEKKYPNLTLWKRNRRKSHEEIVEYVKTSAYLSKLSEYGIDLSEDFVPPEEWFYVEDEDNNELEEKPTASTDTSDLPFDLDI